MRAGRQRLEDVFVRLTAITGEIPVVSPDDTLADGTGRPDPATGHHRGGWRRLGLRRGRQ
jgi:hypothetical protein